MVIKPLHDPDAWRPFVAALLAAGLRGRADWQASVEVVNGLLALRGQPLLDVTDVPVSSP
ncbi:hypothetical protein ACFPIJ_11230 [Dactylosporangium cerinum]|uniref:Uncharacterized protein n=1 Tax=Dactylosporangium cerinum TaxID=1434730 RepID=A0ABV9VPW1_9ACTN